MSDYFKIILKLLLSCCLLLQINWCRSMATSVNPIINFEHIKVKNGLTSDSITAIVQDKFGFIWIGTKFGLNRYDGARIVQYLHQKSNTNSIAANHISCLYADPDGSLWVGYKTGGVDRFNMVVNQFEHFMHKPGDKGSISGGVVRKIIKTSQDDYWMALYEGGINHFNVKTRRFTCYNKANLKGLVNNRIMDIVVYDDAHILVATWDNGGDGGDNTTMLFNTKKHVLRRYFDEELQPGIANQPENKMLLRLVNRIKQGHTDELAGASYHGFWIFSKTTKTLNTWSYYKKEKNPFPFTQINDLEIDNQDLWLGSEKEGLIRYNRKFNSFYEYKATHLNPSDLSSNSIICLLSDNSGNLWIGTEDGGVNIVKAGFRYSFIYKDLPDQGSYNIPQPNHDNYISALSDQHLLYSGTNNLIRLNLVTGDQKILLDYGKHNKREYSMGFLFRTSPFRNQCIIFRNGYFYIYNPQSNSIISKLDIPYTEGVYEIETNKNTYIIRTITNGKIRFFSNNKNLERILNENIIYFNGPGRFFLSSTDSGIYLTNRHISRYVMVFFNKSGIYKTYEYTAPPPGLTTERNFKDGYYFLKRNDGTIWMIRDGITIYDPKTDYFTRFPNKNITDQEIELAFNWSNSRIVIIRKNNITVKDSEGNSYNLFSGLHLPCNYFLGQATTSSDMNSIIVRSDRGFISFIPQQLKKIGNLKPPLITGFRIFNQTMTTDSGIHLKKQIRLQHSENYFTIQFSAMCYQASAPVRYSYKLEGFDQEWKYCGNQSEVQFNNLAPGKYAFRVKYTADGVHWIESAYPLTILISPPFWKQWWFILSALLLIFGIIYLIVSYRIRNIKRLYELRLKISSDLHDDVGGMLTLLAMKAEVAEQADPEKSRYVLRQISDNAREALSGMRDVIWSFDIRTDTVQDLFQRIANFAREIESNPLKSYTVKKEIDHESLKLNVTQKKNLLLMSKEIITNFIKHSDGTQLNIQFTLQEKKLRISFKDNGTKQMTEEQLHGFGLKNLRMRAEELNGEVIFVQNQGFGVTITLDV